MPSVRPFDKGRDIFEILGPVFDSYRLDESGEKDTDALR